MADEPSSSTHRGLHRVQYSLKEHSLAVATGAVQATLNGEFREIFCGLKYD